MDKLSVIGKVISKSVQMFFLALIPLGIYGYFIDGMLGVLSFVFGMMVTFLFGPMLKNQYEYETILHDINNTLHIFTWRNDC